MQIGLLKHSKWLWMKQILLFCLDEAQHVALPNSIDASTKNSSSIHCALLVVLLRSC